MVEELLRQLKEKFKEILESFRENLRLIRSGRAEVGLVENLPVLVYGRKMLLKELASLAIPEPRQIVITPWDKSILPAIEKALRESPTALSPVAEVNFIRLNIPPLTAERREELIKLLKEREEEAKIALRNARHEALKELDRLEKDKKIGEDEKKRGEKQVQEEIELSSGEIDKMTEQKAAEIREV